MQARRLGTIGENTAAIYLENKGYRILQRNFSCRHGEIDLIAAKNGDLCFIEVKTRQTDTYGRPGECINFTKKSHLKATARYYMSTGLRGGFRPKSLQFDVVEIQINHIPNAF